MICACMAAMACFILHLYGVYGWWFVRVTSCGECIVSGCSWGHCVAVSWPHCAQQVYAYSPISVGYWDVRV